MQWTDDKKVMMMREVVGKTYLSTSQEARREAKDGKRLQIRSTPSKDSMSLVVLLETKSCI